MKSDSHLHGEMATVTFHVLPHYVYIHSLSGIYKYNLYIKHAYTLLKHSPPIEFTIQMGLNLFLQFALGRELNS